MQHVIGTVSAADAGSQTITVKADKTGTESTFALADTKTLLRVEPGAKDLKAAVRITAQDLEPGDRVDVRFAADQAATTPIPAKSVLLMSGRDLLAARQKETAAWQNSTAGGVIAVDPSSGTITIRVRSMGPPQALTVKTSDSTAFTRYSPNNPRIPDKSSLGEIHPGDQVRVIGDRDGDTINAQKIYSGTFKTVPATVVSVSSNGDELTIRDLQTKQTLHVTVTPDTLVRRMPPELATALASRSTEAQSRSQKDAASGGPATPSQGGRTRMGGDPSKILQRMPPANVADLKAGDAIMVTGAATTDPSTLIGSAIIAGMEPVFQSSPPRQGQSFSGSDWSLDMSIPAQ
jgi:hypothetical protein